MGQTYMYIEKFYSDILFGSFVHRNTSFAKMGQTYMYIAKFYSDIMFCLFVQRNNKFEKQTLLRLTVQNSYSTPGRASLTQLKTQEDDTNIIELFQ